MSTTTDADTLRELFQKPRSERATVLFDFEAYDYQAELLDYSENQDVTQAAVKPGRQTGKTTSGGVIAADEFLKGSDVLILGPFEDTVSEMMEAFKAKIDAVQELLDGTEWNLTLEKDNELEYESVAGGRVRARTVGSRGTQIRGKNPNVVLVDEAAYIKNSIFTEVIEPFFSTHDRWQFYLFSTPAGKNGYFYDAVEGKNSSEWFSPHWPSSICPQISEAFLDRKREQLDSLTFAQEYLGEFVDEGETLFSFGQINSLKGDQQLAGEKWLGVDIAREGTDRTVYAAIDENGNVDILDNEETSTMDGVLGRIKDLHREYDFTAVIVEENSIGGGVVDFGADLEVIEPFKSSTKTKHQLYKQFQRDIENESLTLPAHRQLIDELTSLEYEFTQHSYMKVHHPDGGHDDFADAVAFANWGRNGGGSKTVTRRNARVNMHKGKLQ
jgi:hypothetical protein